MGRLSAVAMLALSLAPGLASAATVSWFSVQASARMTLASATFADTGGDALGGLDIDYALDTFDDVPQEAGNATVDTTFTRDDATGLAAASATGSAGGPFGSASADVSGRLVQTITNTSAAAIALAFDYTLGFDGSTSGPDAEILGSAFVELQDFFGQVFFAEIPRFSTPPQGFSGHTTLGIGAGETVYAAAYADVVGSAFAFDVAPVPLPATLPLMIAALAGLAAWRWRRSI